MVLVTSRDASGAAPACGCTAATSLIPIGDRLQVPHGGLHCKVYSAHYRLLIAKQC